MSVAVHGTGNVSCYQRHVSNSSSRRDFITGSAVSLLANQTALAIPESPPAAEGATPPAFRQSGATAVSRTVNEKLRDIVSVKDFGAKGDGLADDTFAFQAAIDARSGLAASIYLPPGSYRVTRTIRINKRHVRIFGAGDESCLVFDPAPPGGTLLLVQHSDQRELINYIVLEDFAFRASARSATYAKTGVRLVDASLVTIQNINVTDYSWTGGAGVGSIALHMAGRDTHEISNCRLIADQPLLVSRNPNSTYYSFDYHHFTRIDMLTRRASNYAIRFEPGVNPSNWIVDGNCGAFMGQGGIYLNNQDIPTETPSMIRISHFRVESGTASGGQPGGYGIYMDYGTGNPACGNLMLENCSVNDPTCNGYHLANISALVAVNINCGFAASNKAFTCENVANAYITSLGIGHDKATVQFDQMDATLLHRLAGASPSSKSIAFGLFAHRSIRGSNMPLVYEGGVRRWAQLRVLRTGEGLPLPIVEPGGSMIVEVSSGGGAAIYSVAFDGVQQLSATPDWAACATLKSNSAGATVLTSRLAEPQQFVVTTRGA
jgi:hypothetical protein